MDLLMPRPDYVLGVSNEVTEGYGPTSYSVLDNSEWDTTKNE